MAGDSDHCTVAGFVAFSGADSIQFIFWTIAGAKVVRRGFERQSRRQPKGFDLYEWQRFVKIAERPSVFSES